MFSLCNTLSTWELAGNTYCNSDLHPGLLGNNFLVAGRFCIPQRSDGAGMGSLSQLQEDVWWELFASTFHRGRVWESTWDLFCSLRSEVLLGWEVTPQTSAAPRAAPLRFAWSRSLPVWHEQQWQSIWNAMPCALNAFALFSDNNLLALWGI